MLIREDTGKGLRESLPLSKGATTTTTLASSPTTLPAHSKPSAGFLKPAHVDAPLPTAIDHKKSSTSSAGSKPSAKRPRERRQDGTLGPAEKEGKKRKTSVEGVTQ